MRLEELLRVLHVCKTSGCFVGSGGPGKLLIEDGGQQLTRSKGMEVDKLDSYAVDIKKSGWLVRNAEFEILEVEPLR